MKFFIDFEATRFSNRIISIGCVADNGETFKTLVKPVNKGKVDKFITELTGITNEMVQAAPTADEAFNMLFDFIELNSDGTQPTYYCYGNADEQFLSSTVKFMTDVRACICAQAIKGNIIDYATVVKKFFVVKHDLALRKVYMLITSLDELEQTHDALEDALMLKTIVNNLYDKCKPEDKETILSIPSQPKMKLAATQTPPIFNSWDGHPIWKANTNANEKRWVFKCTDQNNEKNCKYFDNINTVALWLIKYSVRNISPKNENAIDQIRKNVINAIKNNNKRYGYIWEYNPEGAIAATKQDKEVK